MKFKLGIQQFSASEWKTMRILFSIFWVHSIVNVLADFYSIPVPRGWANYIDLSFLNTIPGKIIIAAASITCMVFYIKNRSMILVTGIMFLIGICVYTYQDSQASDTYNEMVNLVVAGQFIAFVYSWYLNRSSIDGKEGTSSTVGDLAIHNSKQAIIACYMIAGFTKLGDAGLHWVSDAPNLSVAIYKMYMHDYVSLLAPELKSTGLYYSSIIVDHPFLVQVAFACVLTLELGGIVALVNRRFSIAVGIAYIFFHVAIGVLTSIRFDHFVVLILIYLMNIGYIINWVMMKREQLTESNTSQ